MGLIRHLKGSLSLRLASKLNLAPYRNSLAHSTKGTPSQAQAPAPTACGRTVSGTVSLPSRGAFHLSLTVLVRYRSWRSTQPWRVVPPASDRVALARPYSGGGMRGDEDSRTGLSPSAAGLSMPFRSRTVQSIPRPRRRILGHPLPQPPHGNASPLTRVRVWAHARSLAATCAVSVDFLSSGYLDVSVPRVAVTDLIYSGPSGRP